MVDMVTPYIFIYMCIIHVVPDITFTNVIYPYYEKRKKENSSLVKLHGKRFSHYHLTEQKIPQPGCFATERIKKWILITKLSARVSLMMVENSCYGISRF